MFTWDSSRLHEEIDAFPRNIYIIFTSFIGHITYNQMIHLREIKKKDWTQDVELIFYALLSRMYDFILLFLKVNFWSGP